MPNYQKRIVYLSDERRQELFENGSITVGGQTIIYSDNDMYVTPQDEPVTDVQVNGSSVVQNGIAAVTVPDVSNYVQKTDYATSGSAGVVKVDNNQPLGIYVNSSTGMTRLDPATNTHIKSGTGDYMPITGALEHAAAFYGLAKAAGDATQSQSSSQVGSYTDGAKAAIQKMLDVADQRVQNIYNSLTNNGTFTFSANDIVQGQWSYHAPADRSDRIRSNILIPVETGMSVVYSSQTQDMYFGVLETPTSNTYISGQAGWNNAPVSNGVFNITSDGWMTFVIRDHANNSKSITPSDYDCTVTIKSSIKTALDSKVQDVQVNGTSILNNGVANIPKASNTVAGVLKTATTYGTAVQDGIIYLVRAISSQIKDGAAYFNPIVPNLQHESAFYGLAKAAGADMASSSNPVGTYTDAAKKAIRDMLGIPNFDSEVIFETTTTEDLTQINITTDNNGLAFELRACKIYVKLPASTTGTADFISTYYTMETVTGSIDAKPFPTLKMPSSSGSLMTYEFETYPGGMYFVRGYASSNFNSSSSGGPALQHDSLIKSIKSFQVRQYSDSSTLIPAGTYIKVIGIRI